MKNEGNTFKNIEKYAKFEEYTLQVLMGNLAHCF